MLIGQQNGLFRREDRGGFGHEVNTAKYDGFGIGGRGLFAKAQGIIIAAVCIMQSIGILIGG